jgi:hypothetical protein
LAQTISRGFHPQQRRDGLLSNLTALQRCSLRRLAVAD